MLLLLDILVAFVALALANDANNPIGSLCGDNGECLPLDDLVDNLKAANFSKISVELNTSFQLMEVIKFDESSLNLQAIQFMGSSTEITISCVQGTSSGFYFSGIPNVTFVNITTENCGGIFEEVYCDSVLHNYSSALFFLNGTDVILQNVVVRSSRGSGAVMLNNFGKMAITGCTFENGYLPGDQQHVYFGGNGLTVILTNVNYSSIEIRDCKFFNNSAAVITNCNMPFSA